MRGCTWRWRQERFAVGEPGPSVRPLGWMAFALALLADLLALSYFYSPLAYPLGLISLGLGFAARTDRGARRLGTLAMGLSLAAWACATIMLLAMG